MDWTDNRGNLDFRFWILDWGRRRMKEISSKRVPVSCSDNRQSKIQNLQPEADPPQAEKWLVLAVLAFALTVCGAVAMAQQTGKVLRIGYLDNSTASGMAVLVDAFRQELSKLGWIEGKNFTIRRQNKLVLQFQSRCSRGRIKSSNDFRFSIADFRLGNQNYE
jgi:hypothetical protein